MILSNQDSWLLIEFSFTKNGSLHDINWTWLEAASIAPAEAVALKAKAENLRQSRLREAEAADGRPSLNKPCPCGSSRKNKKCCLA